MSFRSWKRIVCVGSIVVISIPFIQPRLLIIPSNFIINYPQNLSLRSYKNLSTTIKYILPKKRNLSVKRRKKAVNLFLFPLQLAVSAEPCV